MNCSQIHEVNDKKKLQDRVPRKRGEYVKKSDEQSFEPEYHQIKKMGFKVNKNKFSVGEWNYHENQIYLNFMQENINDFLTQTSRRKSKVFFRLSKILKKRTPDQCRSHHQKLQLKYKDDLRSIIAQVCKKIDKAKAFESIQNEHNLRQTNLFEKSKDLNVRTGFQEEEGDKIMDGKWFIIVSTSSLLRITINEDEIEQWADDN